jgi:nitrate/nitrite transport system substrate-binding protein
MLVETGTRRASPVVNSRYRQWRRQESNVRCFSCRRLVFSQLEQFMIKILSRRSFLKSSALTLAAANALLPFGAARASDAPEVNAVKLGFIALTDSAPLIIAMDKGLFDKYGLTGVEVLKQASWGATRDNIVLGAVGNGIDGAHILTPMAYGLTTGAITQDKQPMPMKILARLNLDGQAISISKAFADLKVGLDASLLKDAFARKKAEGAMAKIAVTFPGGTHDLWMRYWLAAGGIDPDRDVEMIVVPPPQMVANMKVGTMDAFCVGEPWNAQLVSQGVGYTAMTTGELWANHPEKSLAMRADFTDKNPKATQALLMAVMEAQQWADADANKDELADIVSRRAWFNIKKEDILGRLKGDIDYGNGRTVSASPHLMKFWRDQASFPFKSHDAWFLTENQRWGRVKPDADIAGLVNKVNDADEWRSAAKTLGVTDIPASDARGVETFFDGKSFDPANPKAYLDSLAIKAGA